MSSSQVLSVRNLDTRFQTQAGEIRAVDDVSFDLEKGEILGLVGESGSGKSVTGFSIMGLVDEPGEIYGGQIKFKGEDLTKVSSKRYDGLRGREIAMIFQDPMMTLNPLLRIDTQMIEAILAHESVSKDAARQSARDALGMVGISSPDERLRAYPHQFSGGMRQRVVIAISMLHAPDIIIADEPTTALDVTIQAQILGLISDLVNRLQLTVLLITHNLGVVAKTCENAAVMYAGRVVEQAPVKELFRNPQHPYTRGLIQAVPTRQTLRGSLEGIPGLIPNLNNPPKGCRFHPRCAEAKAVCRRDVPSLVHIAERHSVFCHLY